MAANVAFIENRCRFVSRGKAVKHEGSIPNLLSRVEMRMGCPEPYAR